VPVKKKRRIVARRQTDAAAPIGDPVSRVRWVPIDQVIANDYNPNSVARNEMKLLHISVSHDGYKKSEKEVVCPECGKQFFISGGG
jgi:hypothetical protein